MPAINITIDANSGQAGQQVKAFTAQASQSFAKMSSESVAAIQSLNASINQLNANLSNVGKGGGGGASGRTALSHVGDDANKSLAAVEILRGELGVRMPRALETVIARSSSLGPIMNAAFSAVPVIFFAQSLSQVLPQLEDYLAKILGINTAVKAWGDEIAKTNLANFNSFKTPQQGQDSLAKIKDDIARLQKQRDELANAPAPDLIATPYGPAAQYTPNANDFEKIAKLDVEINNLTQQQNDMLQHQTKLNQDNTDELIRHAKAMADINVSTESGYRAINDEAQAAIAQQKALALASPAYVKESSDRIVEIESEALAKRMAISKQIDDFVKKNAVSMGVYLDQSAKDDAKIVEEDGQQQLNTDLKIWSQIGDAWSEYEAARLQLNGDTIGALRIQEASRIDQELESLRLLGANYAQMSNARIALEAQANVKIAQQFRSSVEQMGSDLTSLFDDIASGNLGNRLLKNFESLLGQMVAQWLLSTNAMRGSLGQLLSGVVFGPGSSTAQYFGGPSSVLQFLSGGTPGGTSGGAYSLGGGSTSSLGGLNGILTGNFGAPSVASNFGTDSTIPGANFVVNSFAGSQTTPSDQIGQQWDSLLGGGASSAIPVLAAKTGAAASPFSGALAALAPLLGGVLGSKLGGTAGAIGGSIAGLTASTLLTGLGGPGGTLPALLMEYLGVGPGVAGGLVAGVGGGLLGFGVGENFGTPAGVLSGVGAGALAGLAFGPAGAIIGGIIGLIGGLFGGLLGGSKRQSQANSFFQSESSQIDQVLNGFEGFQISYADALSQLETIRSYSHQQLGGLKSQGNDVFNKKLSPYIDKIEDEIKGDNDERQRRSTLLFGPPEFATGGMIGGSRIAGWRMSGGAVLMVGHEGEGVVTRQAMQQNPGLVDRLNSGGGAPTINLVVNAIDAKSFDKFLREGGGHSIRRSLAMMRAEGHF